MKIHDVKQGDPEWFTLRAGIPTASEFHNLITPVKRQLSKAESYLCYKVAEKWLGRPINTQFKSTAMDDGTVLEPRAMSLFEMETNTTLTRPGFITTESGNAGCSPDGLIEDGPEGVEIKSPGPATHVGYLKDGTLPTEYLLQVQGSIYICTAPHWWFMSYCRGFPPLIIKVERDDELCELIGKAVADFNRRAVALYGKLVELNGGEPVRTPEPQPQAEPVRDFGADDFMEWLNNGEPK